MVSGEMVFLVSVDLSGPSREVRPSPVDDVAVPRRHLDLRGESCCEGL